MTDEPARWARELAPGVSRSGSIDLNDTPAQAVLKLAENDVGAAKICIALIELSQKVDPTSAFGPFTPLIMLDRLRLKGRLIVVFFSLVRGDIRLALGLLHALRMGVLSSDEFGRAMAGKLTLDLDFAFAAAVREIPGLAP